MTLEYTVGTGSHRYDRNAVYSDETTKDVTEEADISGYDKDAEGTQEITVTYTENGVEAKATFNVTVKAAEPTQEPTGTPTQEPTGEPTSTPTQEPTGEPTGTPTQKPTGTQKPSGTPGTGATPGGAQGGGSSAATGDTSNVMPAAAALTLAAGCAAVLAVLKRRKAVK